MLPGKESGQVGNRRTANQQESGPKFDFKKNPEEGRGFLKGESNEDIVA